MGKGQHRSGDTTPLNVRIIPAPDDTLEPLPLEATAPIAIIQNKHYTVERMIEESLDNGTVDFNILIRRGALFILTDPDSPGTLVRCPECMKPFLIMTDEPPNWDLVGMEFAKCFNCMISTPAPAELEEAASPAEEDMAWQEGDVHPEWGDRPLTANEAANLNQQSQKGKEDDDG